MKVKALIQLAAFSAWVAVAFSCGQNDVSHSEEPKGQGQAETASDTVPVLQSFANPILRGFNPDPAICRSPDGYFIATSSFEWYPGVPLYQSKDLVHWRPIGHALTAPKHFDMRGIPASAGIYAPSLHYHQGRYYLLYTVVQSNEGAWPFTATPNYLTWTDDIFGEWSDPVFLNAVGFDPSLFIDDDGNAYALSMVMDYQKIHPAMGKIALQQIELESGRPIGELKYILNATDVPGTEGPHLYKRSGYYYLLVAQGGTFYDHQATLYRSENLGGPYEQSPYTPLISSKADSTLRLQRAGHGNLVEAADGQWFMSYLASRSVMPERKSPLGRESCLEPVEWTEDGWLRMASGTDQPQDSVSIVSVPHLWEELPDRDAFDSLSLRVDYQWLREPQSEEWLKLGKGRLHLKGRRPSSSTYDLSLIARRLSELDQRAETRLHFLPENFRHKAGLAVYYDNSHHYCLVLTHMPEQGRVLELFGYENAQYKRYAVLDVADDVSELDLSFQLNTRSVSFSYRLPGGEEWQAVGEPLDLLQLADELHQGYGFTGSMAALVAMDGLYGDKWASFEHFTLGE